MVSNVRVEDAVIARLRTHGQDFEVLVDCDNALELKSGKDVDMRDVLADEKVFANSKKGLVVTEAALKQAFDTDDPVECAKIIIKKGEIQLTSEHRKKVLEEEVRDFPEP